MDPWNEIKQKDFERLKEVAGEEIATKYFKEKDYNFKEVGSLLIKYVILRFAKENKTAFILLLILIVLVCLSSISG